MDSIVIESKYNLKWQLKELPHYKISECKNIFNCKTNRKLKRVVNGYTIGYWINKKFIPLNKLNNYCELIKLESIPF